MDDATLGDDSALPPQPQPADSAGLAAALSRASVLPQQPPQQGWQFQPPQQQASPYNQPLIEELPYRLGRGFEAMGVPPQLAYQRGADVARVMSMVPGLGQMMKGSQGVADFRAGNYGAIARNAATMALPGAVRAGGRVLQGVGNEIPAGFYR